MHSCPECGQACYCNGDIDDIDANAMDGPPFCEHPCIEPEEDDRCPDDPPEVKSNGQGQATSEAK